MRRVFNVIESNTPAVHVQLKTAPADCVPSIQREWAEALRCDFARTREAKLCKLAETTQELLISYPNDAKILLWNGVVLTGYAKSLGGLAGLALLKRAKVSLERAITLAPNDGAAYLYLGLLYESTPESPYGFGDETLARTLLEQGLALTLNTPKKRLRRMAAH
jgi:hypothetical protein